MNVELRRVYTEAEQALIDQFEAALPALPGGQDMETMRANAHASFASAGLPHRRMEEWKYTDLRAALRKAYPLGKGSVSETPVSKLASEGYPTITFVNGRLIGDLPTVDGATIRSLAESLEEAETLERLGMAPARGTNPVYDLNAAFLDHGLVIDIAPGAEITKPIHVRSIITDTTPASYFGRVLLRVGEGAEVTLIESFRGDQAAFQRNNTIQILVENDAAFTHIRVEDETEDAVHLSNLIVEIGENAKYRKFGLSIGAALMRNDLSIKFNGEHSRADVASIFLKDGKQHHDTTMFVDHAVPNCESRELFKSVLGGNSRGVFQGKILVRPHAQKTDGEMSANAILLSETAEMDAKPELEIYADDVVCGHGATAGELDEDLLFFLRARGIPEREAKALLIEAFIGEAFDSLEIDAVKDVLVSMTHDWVEQADI